MNTMIRLTLLEMLKKKILYLTLILTAIFLTLYGVALNFAYDSLRNEAEVLLRIAVSGQFLSMGIYATGFIISFLSVFASVGAISSEIEQGTYDAILSKPIARYEIVLGRFIGVLFVLLSYTTFLYSSILGINMLFGKGIIANFTTISLIKSLGVLYLLPTLLSSVGIYLSCSLSTMGAGVTLVIIYFCGMIGGILEQIGHFITGSAKEVLTSIGIITSLVIPSDIIYRKTASLLFTTGSGMNISLQDMLGASVQPSGIMMAYIGVYIIGMVVLALRKFQGRDL
ncbi:ABC-type transport system involved in multi-copper enzyme maturation permease subunit [Anaerosolibacter carboniphilus]|uniref:ABC-type transport system involved in multi-copper enzyme maturation permease subunit n=1 Tax=Anaerosolibacter carboniphilus TaxID=1417629 RepID=A0A841KYC6_9FIRM|nr:ABC transporter permease [Anaerosolibacter carboniphilus]MBB6218357.1 ABC-type transport system involved in multi-copper enzyme maturation permease subunit [Anaerosolibacter carboniphilus]